MAVVKKKTWPESFEAIKSGKKKCDLRLDDFDIEEGDTLVLEEWDPKSGTYTGRRMERKVSHVFKFELDKYGQEDEIKEKGLQVISIE